MAKATSLALALTARAIKTYFRSLELAVQPMAGPHGNLTLSGTTLYGMTQNGGLTGDGNIFSVGIDGTNYRNLLSFTGSGGLASGENPSGSLTLSGTTFYGVTQLGGVSHYGNIFSVGIDGSDYHDLYNFSGGSDGGDVEEGELVLTGGTLFGVTLGGGSALGDAGDGTVFAFALPTPEPGTLAIVGAATAIVSYRRRRMRSRAKIGIATAMEGRHGLSFRAASAVLTPTHLWPAIGQLATRRSAMSTLRMPFPTRRCRTRIGVKFGDDILQEVFVAWRISRSTTTRPRSAWSVEWMPMPCKIMLFWAAICWANRRRMRVSSGIMQMTFSR